METLSYTAIRNRLARALDQVNDDRTAIVIARQKGRPAVLGNALRAARGLGDPALRASVEAVAAGDPYQGVRHEAREALHKWGIPLARGPRER